MKNNIRECRDMRDVSLCGNGGLLQYVKKKVGHDGDRIIHETIEDIADADYGKCFETSDIFLAVS